MSDITQATAADAAEASAPAWAQIWNAACARVSHGPRLLVADGSCGRAMGATEVLAALRSEVVRRGLVIDVVGVGCDGRCYASVQVTFYAGGGLPRRWARVSPEGSGQICDVVASAAPTAPPESQDDWEQGQRHLLLADAGQRDPLRIDEAIAAGTYGALAHALVRPSQEIVDIVAASGLLGLGGAYFPTGRKWQACARQPGPRYVVVNAEEGEPGVFKDRHLLEDQPHRLLEGALIAAYAIRASRVLIYLNGQARLAVDRTRRAVAAARGAGLLGARILGSEYSCEVELREGAGGYVLGEETVLLESIEGRKPMPRFRPPHAVERGLWGRPTLVNNVETLSRIPGIISAELGGAAAESASMLTATKLVCVSGDVQRPGLVEIPFGTSLRDIVVGMAGGPASSDPIQAVLAGGPSGVLVPPRRLDEPLVPHGAGISIGSGNLTVLDARRSLIETLRLLTRFNTAESCGKCTPCREGVRVLGERLGAVATAEDLTRSQGELLALCEIIGEASLCGLGKMAPGPVQSALHEFPASQIMDRHE